MAYSCGAPAIKTGRNYRSTETRGENIIMAKIGRPKLLSLKLCVVSAGNGNGVQLVKTRMVANRALQELILETCPVGTVGRWLHPTEWTVHADAREIEPSIQAATYNLLHHIAPLNSVICQIMGRHVDMQILFSNAYIRKAFENGDVNRWAAKNFKYRSGGTHLEHSTDWHLLYTLLCELGVKVCYTPTEDTDFNSLVIDVKSTVNNRMKTLNKMTKLSRRRK